MATSQDPIGRIVQNIFTMQRIGNTINADSQALLDEMFEQIVEDLRRIDPTAPAADRWKRYRMDQFLDRVRERLRKTFPAWHSLVRGELVQAGQMQAQFAQQLLVVTLGEGVRVRPTPITGERLRTILTTNPFGDAERGKALLSEWSEGLEATTRERIRNQVRLGMTNEEGIPEIVRRIRGDHVGFTRQDPKTGQFVPKGTPGAVVKPKYKGGVWQATTRDAEAVVRTAVNHIGNVGMVETYQANGQVLKGLKFSATLDDRTTLACAALDGMFWPLDSNEIKVPPIHWNCRSVLVPEPDWEKMGLREPEEGERAARDLSDVSDKDLNRKVSARRGSKGLGKYTTVPSSVRYEEWLRDQPARVQNKVLGVTRANLFRRGDITLRELVRTDGSIIPLDELPL